MPINKVNPQTAKTLYIDTTDASYGIFCYNSIGDLFLNSDYGTYGFAWRHFGDDFEKFLSQCNADYIMGKFESNYYTTIGKKVHKNWVKHATMLIEYFIQELKNQQALKPTTTEAETA